MADIKQNQKPEKPKPKKSYIIIVEGFVPVTMQYRVSGEDEDEAIERFKLGYARLESQPRIDHRKITKKKVLVKEPGSVFTKPYPPF
jgi:hypothetical protein